MEGQNIQDKKGYLMISIGIAVLLFLFVKAIMDASISAPVFSVKSGFYNSEFELELTVQNPNLTIYYTTDGSVPTEESIQYKEPIKIYDYSVNENNYSAHDDIAFEEARYGYVWVPKEKVRKAMVVKAVAYNKYGKASGIINGTYFIGKEYEELPVIAISMDPDDLFGYNGIYVKGKTYAEWYKKNKDNLYHTPWGYPSNFQLKGKEWERKAKIEIIEDGKQTFGQDIGIRVRGGSTRFFEQKSFSIYARQKYGEDTISYQLFPENYENIGEVIETYDSFMLRNWGNNWRTYMFIDPLVQSLVHDRNISTQYSQTCVVFLNGEYWGLYDMKEKYGPEYFKQHYGIEEENLIMVKAQATKDRSGRAVEIGSQSEIEEYERLENFVKENDLSLKENYDILCNMVDIDSFIDLYAIRMYVEAVDFPTNNWACWKTRTVSDAPYQDGKRRWMLYDVDSDMQYPNYYNGLEISEQYSLMFSKLLKNEEFRSRYITMTCDLMNNNFDFEAVNWKLADMYNECLPYICEYYDRFGPIEAGNSDIEKLDYYCSLYNKMIKFFANQKKYIQNLFKEKELVSGEIHKVNVEADKNAGKIFVNSSLVKLENGHWTGDYFSDFPVELFVEPDLGSKFKGWYDGENNLISQELNIKLELNEDIQVVAVFE